MISLINPFYRAGSIIYKALLTTLKLINMKTLLTLLMLVSMALAGMVSLHLFEKAAYNMSALFTIVSFLSITLWVMLVGNKKIILS
jgi:hypothetical protein